jgi:biotin carboxyl carrier protein
MEIPVVSNFAGVILSVFVDEGEMVNEDQKLIELDKKD